MSSELNEERIGLSDTKFRVGLGLSILVLMSGAAAFATGSAYYSPMFFLGALGVLVSLGWMIHARRNYLVLSPEGLLLRRGFLQVRLPWKDLAPFNVRRIWFKKWVLMTVAATNTASDDVNMKVIYELLRRRGGKIPLQALGSRPEDLAANLNRWRERYGV